MMGRRVTSKIEISFSEEYLANGVPRITNDQLKILALGEFLVDVTRMGVEGDLHRYVVTEISQD
jgi:hypothetical protein